MRDGETERRRDGETKGRRDEGTKSGAVNLRSYRDKSFPSFFKGGVAGISVFGMFTILLSRPGWLKRI